MFDKLIVIDYRLKCKMLQITFQSGVMLYWIALSCMATTDCYVDFHLSLQQCREACRQ
jgi:hypothetical protein